MCAEKMISINSDLRFRDNTTSTNPESNTTNIDIDELVAKVQRVARTQERNTGRKQKSPFTAQITGNPQFLIDEHLRAMGDLGDTIQ